MFRIFLITLFIMFAYGCTVNNSDIELIDEELIVNYIAQNKLKANNYNDGLYYYIENESTQMEYPNITSTITVKYKGYLLDGTVVDSSNNKFITINLADCIEGWQVGIPLFSRNNKGKLFIPSSMAYGEYSTPTIPPYSIIVYDIELKSFTNE